MPGPLLPAAIGAAGSIFGNLIGNIGAGARQRRANRENIEFWNMQNAYNHPTAQMQRLREAGLNPNLIYGTSPSSAVGQSDKIAPSKPADFRFDNPLGNITQFSDVKVREAQTDNLRTQNTVLQQEAALKAAQTANQGANTAKTKFELGIAKELKDTSIQAAQESLRQMEQGTIQKELDNSFKSQSLKNMVKEAFYRAENARENLSGNQKLNELRQLEIDLKRLGIEKGDPWYFRILGRNWQQLDKFLKN